MEWTRSSASRPELALGEVHVWRAWLDLPREELEPLNSCLNAEERARVAAKRFPRDRGEALASRGILRRILARYTGEEPSALAFRTGEHGKPALDQGSKIHPIRFNLSHSSGVALVALARDREVGIDVEHIERTRIDDALAARVMTTDELELWHTSPEEQRTLLFFRLWTAKEAWVKATGRGLSLDPLSFQVLEGVGAGRECRIVSGVCDSTIRGSVSEIDPGPGWVATVVVEGDAFTVRLAEFG
jgi:4'-phosphopantetheinyl transferase